MTLVDTLARLEELEKLEEQAPPNRSAFTREFGPMLISCLFDHPELIKPELLKPDFFVSQPERWVVATMLNYLEEHEHIPTRTALKEYANEKAGDMIWDEPDTQPTLDLIERKTNPRDTLFVKAKYQAWLRDRAYGLLFDAEAIDAYHRGDYAHLTNLITQANILSSPLEGEPFGFIDAADFMREEISIEWLITDLLVKDQPCIVGGKDKCLKTGTVCDLAISLATGTPFLNHFGVPQPRRVAFFSAESGKMDIKRRFQAVLRGKGIANFPADTLKISFARPQLSSLDDLTKLGRTIAKYRAEIVIVDPLYLTLLAGDDSNTSASDLYGMGNKFGTLSDVVSKAGATAILVHHYKKTTEEGVLGLNEFTFTGASAFARQSLHIGRRRPYSGPTTNQMRFMNHGFANGTTYALDINEDTWETRIEPEAEAVTRATVTRTVNDAAELVAFLRAAGDPLSKNKIREGLRWNDPKFRSAVAASGGQVEEVTDQGKRLYRAI